ncbi:MAG: hypothetical protein AAFV25_21375, partial [Bacteroidota bacterium]
MTQEIQENHLYDLLLICEESDVDRLLDVERSLHRHLNPLAIRIRSTVVKGNAPIPMAQLDRKHLAGALVLISPAMVEAKVMRTEFFRKLMYFNRVGEMIFLPLYVKRCSLVGTSLQRLEVLERNEVPLSELPLSIYQEQMRLIAREISKRLHSCIQSKEEESRHWKEAVADDTAEAYEQFAQQHPYSRHIPEASLQHDRLKDDKLWAEAKAYGEPSFYLQYLLESNQQLNAKAAKEQLVEMESDEQLALQDVLDNQRFSIWMDYKLRFEQKGDMAKIDAKLYDYFGKYSPGDADGPMHITANLLEYRLFLMESREELYNYLLVKQSWEKVYADLEKLAKNKASQGQIFPAALAVMAMVGIGSVYIGWQKESYFMAFLVIVLLSIAVMFVWKK